MNIGWNLVTGTATRYLLLAVNVCLGIFLMPYTLRHFGSSECGLWMLMASITSYFQLLDLGYGSGLVQHIADANARGDSALVNRLLSTFAIVHASIGLLAGAGSAVSLFGFERAVRARYLGLARHAFVSVLAVIGSVTRRAGAIPATI